MTLNFKNICILNPLYIQNFMNKKSKHKINTIILFLGVMVFVFNPLHAFSQKLSVLDSTISYKARNITLYEALNQIGDIIKYEFSYNADLIAANSEIKANYDNNSVKYILTDLIKDSTLQFQVIDKQIVISKKSLLNNRLTLKENFENKLDYFQVRGKVFDKATKEPLSFANISLLGKSVGTVSNEEGEFNLKIFQKNISDTLVISFIGYKNTYIPINQLSVLMNRIYLEEDQYQIQEVVIRTNEPQEILQEAIEKIRDNYYTDPYYITSFYREIVTNKDQLAAITEAVLEVYKSPYWGLFSDQIKMIKSRKNEYYSAEDTVSLKLKGGLYASLYLDMIKNPSIFLNEDFFHNFTYNIADIVKFDNSTAYLINFKPRVFLQEETFEGNIYIHTDNLAIVAIEFKIDEDAIDKIGNNLVVKKSFGTRVRPTSAKYFINYRKINGKYFLNLVRGELEFKVKFRKKLFTKDFTTIFEFASNNIDTTDVKRFDRVETISSHNIFIDENFKYDHQFWGDYNYISPDETLEEALIRIQEKLEKLEE